MTKYFLLGKTSEETCTDPFKAITLPDGVLLKVFRMPRGKKEWNEFNRWIRLYNQDPKAVGKDGLMLEKLRRREGLDPNRLLFAIHIKFS